MARYLKNIKTGVVTVVSADDDQKFYDLVAERDENRQPVYAQTGAHDPAVTQVHVTGAIPGAPAPIDAPQPTVKEVDAIITQRYSEDAPADEKKTAKSA